MKKSQKKPTEKKTAASEEVADDSPRKPDSPEEFLVVGIGASAGGIQALKQFFERVPADSGMAYVVILHLSPDHDSRLAEVLQQSAQIPVTQVKKRVRVAPDHVYVVPPNEHLTMTAAGDIEVTPNLSVEDRRAPVDIFFRTLAESHRARAVAVVLSGTGANGSMGIKRIKERGGAAFVQNPREAEFSEMPRNSIATDLIDRILNAHEIPRQIIAYKESLGKVEIPVEAETRSEEQQQALREIFTQLRTRTGHDFSNYKRATVLRRIERRINVRQLADLPAYAAYVRDNADEATALLKDLLISVTNFFRDKEAFLFLETDVLPKIFHGKTGEDAVRIWVAGCATGEEAYGLAMLCAERISGAIDAPAVQIFASDIDEQAIQTAREGFYTLNDAADVSPERLRRFFTKENDGYRVRRELREMVLFANHNLLKDPAFSHLDLVTCRNLLIYLNPTAQDRVMETFHFALEPGGFLLLGNSETTDGASDLYAAISKEHRIYQSRHVAARISYSMTDSSARTFRFDKTNRAPANPPALPMPPEGETRPSERVSYADLHLRLLEQYTPSVLINEQYDIVHLAGSAARFLRMKAGEPTQNLLKLIVPELRLELRTALYQAAERQTNVEVRNLKMPGESGETINIYVRPVAQSTDDTARGFVLVLFETARDGENRQAVYSSAEPIVGQLEAELVRAQTHLRQTVEQFEVQSEELKASNEEYQAINEELRSAAEELETSKEELQSVNEELITVNQELKVKIEELSQSTSDFSNLINSTDVATIFLDRSFRVHTFTPAASRIFNLIPADAGRPITDITHRLEQDGLLADAERVLETLQTVEREARTTDGRTYLMRVLPYRTQEDRINGVVASFIDITERKRAEELLRVSEERLQRAINIETVGVLFFNNDIEITDCNDAFVRMSGYTRQELRAGRFSWETFTPDRFAEVSRRAVEELNTTGTTTPYEKEYIRKDGSRFWALFAAKRIGENEIVEFVTDITEQKRAQANLRESEARRNLALDAAQMGTFLYHPLEDRGEPDARMLELFGLQAGDALNLAEALDKMIHPDDRESYAAAVAEAIDPRGDGKLDAEIRVVRPDQSIHWINIVARTIFEGDPPKPVRMYGTAADITERKRADEFQNFRLKLSDALRPLSDPVAVQETAMQVLGAQLGVNRAFYGEVLDDENTIIFNPGYADALPMLTGQMKFSDFDTDMMQRYRAGQTVVLNDIPTDVQFTEQAQTLFEGIQVRAAVGVPLVKNNRVRAILSIHQSAPRTWTADEIKILEETAERTWAAVTRARAEEALAASEEKFRTLFNSIDEGYLICEVIFDDNEKPVDILYLDANPAAARLAGRDFTGRRMREIDPDYEDYWYEMIGRVALTGEAVRAEHYAETHNRWFDFYAFKIGGAESRRVASVFQDITTRKHAEEAVRESRERLRFALEAARVGAWDLDLTTGQATRSPLHDRIFGAAESEPFADWSYERFLSFIHPDDRAEVERKFTDALEQSREWRFECRIIWADASVHWIEAHGSVYRTAEGEPARMLGIVSDITQRKRAERALRESEERLRDVLDSMAEGFALLDADFTIIDVNEETVRLDGRPRGELIGRSHWEAFPGSEDSPVGDILRRVAREGAPGALEHEYRWTDERSLWLDMRAYPTGDGGVAIFWRDFSDRKRAEEALRESEARLQKAMQIETVGVLFYDADGNFLDANAAFLKQIGYTRREFNNRRLTSADVTPPEWMPRTRAALDELKATGRFASYEKELMRPDGSRTWALCAGTQLSETEGVEYVVDITDLKKLEESVRQSETRLRLATDAGELGAWEWNLKTDEVYWNEQHFILFGMQPRPNPLRSRDFFDHVHPNERERVGALLQKSIAERSVFETDFRAVLETGDVRWMSGYGRIVEEAADGEPLKMSGLMSDITTRKRAEEALRESEERFRLLIESASDHAIFTTTSDGLIDSWNAGAEKVFGWTEREVLGASNAIIFTPEDREKGAPEQEIETALSTGRAPDERFHIRRDGSRFYASGVMTVLKNDDGAVQGFVKIARDMTEQIEAQKTVRDKELLQKLVTAQEDERKRIARDLHDELGQQLTALRIKLDAIRKNQNEPVLLNQLNHVQDIARSIDDGVDFLAWELRPSTLDDLGLTAALDNYVKQWSHYAKVKAELTISNLKRARFAPEVETCLYRIVQEALNNTHKHAAATNVDIVLKKRGDLLILIVEDNGKGFNQKSKTNRSKGLGLIGMRERAQLVGGTLEVETAAKQGTTIYVRIPFSAAKEK